MMKKILRIFLILGFMFFPLCVHAEDLTNSDVKLVNGICVSINTNQPVTGIVAIYGTDKYGHSYLTKKIEYFNGLKNYKCYTYLPTGEVVWEALFLKGKLDGQTIHYLGQDFTEYYNFTNNTLEGYGYEFGNVNGVLMVNDGHSYGWINDKKLSSAEAQRMANQALENAQALQNKIFSF
ncbi:hypothetical protein SDC9_32544 [bioreactor metagenome]|jgi:hypothetical protein|uniref:Uncharacterized protein n=1 Tax=bioreactor metagenome TaxID=1076179 RepID=A0A644V6Z9_9ZZZZ|nr:hypothetical protein [Acidaminococcaceae bacterium]NLU43842.1 hypothetical protein [Acholeplasmataceae bacterium]